jgi:hypothetical protein
MKVRTEDFEAKMREWFPSVKDCPVADSGKVRK